MSDFESTFVISCKIASEVLLQTGQHVPQAVFLTDSGVEIAVLPNLPYDLRARHEFAAAAAKAVWDKARDKELRAVLFMSEAWTSDYTQEQMANANVRRPAEDPQRKEALVVVGRDVAQHGPTRMWQGEIVREGGKPVAVTPLDMGDNSTFQSEMLDGLEAGWHR